MVEMVKAFDGYRIRVKDLSSKFPIYVQKVHNGAYEYTYDYCHAKVFKTETTAKKHIKVISEDGSC